jgi:nucleoside-diphosphate-sugar epimerase
MKVLLTGSDGYIGALAGPMLIDRGHEVIGVDTGFYREGWLYNDGIRRSPGCITADIRSLGAEDLEGFDAVVHLAELADSPFGEIDPEITFEVNHRGSVGLARRAKEAGVERFVYLSSWSVYGPGFDDTRTEESETHPPTPFAQCKILVERDVKRLADEGFSPTFLRAAEAYGPSPRMRFDLLVNRLAAQAWTGGRIELKADGWQPLVHVRDICSAVASTLEAPRDAVHNQVFNVGDSGQNYRIREVAEIVAGAFPGCEVVLGTGNGEADYRVSFDKIRDALPGFSCQSRLAAAPAELRALFERIEMTPAQFRSRPFSRLEQIEYLLRTAQLDERLYWRSR